MNFHEKAAMGRFKTAHPGWVEITDKGHTPDDVLSPFIDKTVCAKQLYEKRERDGAIKRVGGRYELSAFVEECNRVRWASILLDLTYQFIEREIERGGRPDFAIPKLRYTRAMIAIVLDDSKEKAFFVEEWIETDEGDRQFQKYVNNRHATSCVPIGAPPKVHYLAEFLLFSQHVQWEKTKMMVFVSDYQGEGGLLTDPQITTDSCVINLIPSRLSLTDIVNYQRFRQTLWCRKPPCGVHGISRNS